MIELRSINARRSGTLYSLRALVSVSDARRTHVELAITFLWSMGLTDSRLLWPSEILNLLDT